MTKIASRGGGPALIAFGFNSALEKAQKGCYEFMLSATSSASKCESKWRAYKHSCSKVRFFQSAVRRRCVFTGAPHFRFNMLLHREKDQWKNSKLVFRGMCRQTASSLKCQPKLCGSFSFWRGRGLEISSGCFCVEWIRFTMTIIWVLPTRALKTKTTCWEKYQVIWKRSEETSKHSFSCVQVAIVDGRKSVLQVVVGSGWQKR